MRTFSRDCVKERKIIAIHKMRTIVKCRMGQSLYAAYPIQQRRKIFSDLCLQRVPARLTFLESLIILHLNLPGTEEYQYARKQASISASRRGLGRTLAAFGRSELGAAAT